MRKSYYGLVLSLSLLISCNEKPSVAPNKYLTVYPNPASHRISVQLNNSGNFLKKLFVYNTEGKTIEEIGSIPGGIQTIDIDITAMEPGYFFVTLQTASGTETQKVLKQ